MQDLASATKALNDTIASIKAGGWMAVVVLIAILAFLLLKPVLARQRKATQEVNVTMPASDVNGGASGNPLTVIREHEGRISRVEGGILTLTTSLETVRTENRQDHQKLFDEIASSRTP